MPVQQTNDNLSLMLAALDAAHALPVDADIPAPAMTLATAKRHLGIDPEAWIMNYTICPVCWKHFTSQQLSSLQEPNCTTQGCCSVIYKVTMNARGQNHARLFLSSFTNSKPALYTSPERLSEAIS